MLSEIWGNRYARQKGKVQARSSFDTLSESTIRLVYKVQCVFLDSRYQFAGRLQDGVAD